MIKTKLASSLLLSLLASSLAFASTGYYTWTDKDGVTHYSEKAPKDGGVNATFVQTKRKRVSEQSTSASNSTEQSAEVDTEEAAEETEEKVKEVFKKDMATCQKALKSKQTLMQNPIIRTKDGVMTMDQKNKQLKIQEEIIKVHC